MEKQVIFRTDLIEHEKLKGFYRVPRFDWLWVSHLSEVYDDHFGIRRPTNGIYRSVQLRAGLTYKINRLMAMTFIECPGSFEDYLVNHLDGNPGNDFYDNLEWTTHTGNLIHAHKTGLRTDTQIVRSYDITTGVEVTYYSLSECARNLSLNNSSVHNILRAEVPKLVDGRFLLVRGDNVFPDIWVDHVRTKKYQVPSFKREKVRIHVTDTLTGEERTWSSYDEFAEHVEVKPSRIRKAIYINGGWKHFKIRYVG